MRNHLFCINGIKLYLSFLPAFKKVKFILVVFPCYYIHIFNLILFTAPEYFVSLYYFCFILPISPPVQIMVLSKFFFSLFLNLILFFKFTILYWFCHVSAWIQHRYTRVPHPEPSSLLPPHTIPLGLTSAPAPSIQYRASNLDWRLDSFPKSSHPLPLPQSPKDCSIHQCNVLVFMFPLEPNIFIGVCELFVFFSSDMFLEFSGCVFVFFNIWFFNCYYILVSNALDIYRAVDLQLLLSSS